MNKTIGFTDAMIQALPSNGGCKTQTRRLMVPQPEFGFNLDRPEYAGCITYLPLINSPYMVEDIVAIRDTDINIEITGVRVERVQDISEDDAKAEGVEFRGGFWLGGIHPVKDTLQCWPFAKMAFSKIWQSIYGATEHNWAANPWVWVYEFKEV